MDPEKGDFSSPESASAPHPQSINYDPLFNLLAKVPEAAIYRRFGSERTQRLYYLAANVVRQHNALKEFQRQVREGISRPSTADSHCVRETKGNIYETLMENYIKSQDRYDKAVLRDTAIAALSEPNEYHMEDFRDNLNLTGKGIFGLTGENAAIYGARNDPIDPDLLAIRGYRTDPFTNLVIMKLIKPFYRCIGYRIFKDNKRYGMPGFEGDTLFGLTLTITCIFAPLLQAASIAVLYCVQSMKARLAIITAFGLVFSISARCLGGSSRSEIFTNTAAYFAVMVVFVGTVNNHTTSQ